jgi:uncharacterized lipoprotein YajG
MLSKVVEKVLVITALLSISGCAFTTGHVDLEYQPASTGTKIATAQSPPVAVKIVDKRSTQIVGSKINGFGMKTADIISDSDVPATLKSAFETELKNRGFKLGSNGLLLVVELRNLQNQFALGFFSGESTGSIGMDVIIQQLDGAKIYDQYITGQGQDWIEIGDMSNAQKTLDAAIQNAVSKTFSDSAFIEALQRS